VGGRGHDEVGGHRDDRTLPSPDWAIWSANVSARLHRNNRRAPYARSLRVCDCPSIASRERMDFPQIGGLPGRLLNILAHKLVSLTDPVEGAFNCQAALYFMPFKRDQPSHSIFEAPNSSSHPLRAGCLTSSSCIRISWLIPRNLVRRCGNRTRAKSDMIPLNFEGNRQVGSIETRTNSESSVSSRSYKKRCSLSARNNWTHWPRPWDNL
jgi:hypothetical protein